VFTVLVVVTLATAVPSASVSAARPGPVAGCESITLTAAPGMGELGVRRAVQCAAPTKLGGRLVAGPEGLWANTWEGTLVRLDPRTFAVTATVDIPYVQGIVLRDDGLWALVQNLTLVDGNRQVDVLDLVKVDRASGRVLRTTRLPLMAAHSSDDQAYLAATADALWVAQANVPLVARVDPRDASVVATVPLPGRTEAMAGNASTLWLELWADDPTGTSRIVAVDATTNAVANGLACECGGIGRSSKMIVTDSDVWFSGSALTHVDVATGAITTHPRTLTGGLTSAGTDVWAIGPVAITSPTPDGRWGLVTRITPGSSEPAVGAIVPMKSQFDSLGSLSTSDGRTLFALRTRAFPNTTREPAQIIVRLTLAR